MENNNQDNKKPTGSKFNSYWIYGLLALFLLALNFYNLTTTSNEPLNWGEFAKMVRDQDIERLEVINKEYASIYIKESRLSKYPDAATSKFNTKNPNFVYQIGTLKGFEEKLEQIQEDEGIKESDRLYPINETRQNWLAPILSWVLPIVIIIAIWVFIMRRVSGGAGGPGSQIFNIGKSKATLFDNNAKVNVTFEDVAGLDEAKEEVMEVVDFLKQPKNILRLVAKFRKEFY